MRWAVPTALGRCAESEDFQAPMRAAGGGPPRHEDGTDALRPIRQSEVIGPGWTQAASSDHSKPSTAACAFASWRASIRSFTVGKGKVIWGLAVCSWFLGELVSW